MNNIVIKIDKNLAKGTNKNDIINNISEQIISQISKKIGKIEKMDEQSSDFIRKNKPSGVNSLLPRPHNYPYKILDNGKIFTKIDKNSENLDLFTRNYKEDCGCIYCWYKNNFELEII